MDENAWINEFPADITVCDVDGIILELNDRATLSLEKEGGRALIGTNLLDCHPEPARQKLKKMMETRQPNVYTIEKKGAKRLIYQSPWFIGGEYRGFVELDLVIPFDMPHFIREG